MLKAVYNGLGRPSLYGVAAVAAVLAAASLLAVAAVGAPRLVSAVSLMMSLVTLAGLAVLWDQGRKARDEARLSQERTEVTFRRILAAVEVERLANERRQASGIVPAQDQNRP